ncbi:hypothetical protein [Streptomyces sp. SP18CS02]|uniref:hypothetical protein n=1 Tax=Streptomyces sp. SP18CS02 TaxID=3002531 RepID=UPI002E77A2BE|nr:hypothetical protein [Streptomyces sp. SP18CS02]MEE1755483.1 hypothetical protein [Streptomyces sp. SP18CS02]
MSRYAFLVAPSAVADAPKAAVLPAEAATGYAAYVLYVAHTTAAAVAAPLGGARS